MCFLRNAMSDKDDVVVPRSSVSKLNKKGNVKADLEALHVKGTVCLLSLHLE